MKILKYPDKRLKQKTQAIEAFDVNLLSLGNQMYELMKTKGGAGLAAPQIGISQRVIVLEESLLGHRIICNPTWEPTKGALKLKRKEGCLSLPGLVFTVARYDKVSVIFQGANGQAIEMELEGFAAHVFQHEVDHINGVLSIDHV